MKCNGCWNEVEPKSQCVATHCGHLFCGPLTSPAIIHNHAVPKLAAELVGAYTISVPEMHKHKVSLCRSEMCRVYPRV